MSNEDLDLERLRIHADKQLLELAMHLYGTWLVLDAKGEVEHADALADILQRNEEFLRRRIDKQFVLEA